MVFRMTVQVQFSNGKIMVFELASNTAEALLAHKALLVEDHTVRSYLDAHPGVHLVATHEVD